MLLKNRTFLIMIFTSWIYLPLLFWDTALKYLSWLLNFLVSHPRWLSPLPHSGPSPDYLSDCCTHQRWLLHTLVSYKTLDIQPSADHIKETGLISRTSSNIRRLKIYFATTNTHWLTDIKHWHTRQRTATLFPCLGLRELTVAPSQLMEPKYLHRLPVALLT